jgi:hypothetical protein
MQSGGFEFVSNKGKWRRYAPGGVAATLCAEMGIRVMCHAAQAPVLVSAQTPGYKH